MREQRGKIALSAVGELNHRILPGTHIGDLTITEKVFEQMAQVEAGTGVAPDFLALVEGLVRHDLEKMKTNASRLPAELQGRMAKAGVIREPVENITLPPALHFTHQGTVVTTAKRRFGGHRFTDAEVAALVSGEVIEITATSTKTGKPYTATGTLEAGVMEKNGKKYPFVGFKPQFEERAPRTDLVEGVWKGKKVSFKGRGWGANEHWSGKDFTEQELVRLLAGETIEFKATSKTGKPYTAKGALAARTYQGQKTFGFVLKFEDRKAPTGARKRQVSK
jgi:DNA topoisomerase-3